MRKVLIFSFALAVGVMFYSAKVSAVEVGDKGTAMWHGKAYPAEVTKKKTDQCFVHWIGESGSWDEWQACSSITVTEAKGKVAEKPSTKVAYDVGDPVSVNWKGTWYPAHVIAVNKNKDSFKIHYDNYNDSWDEWVGTSRIKK